MPGLESVKEATMEYKENDLDRVIDEQMEFLKGQEGFNGVGKGIDQGQPAIVVFADMMPRASKEAISRRLGDVPHRFEETGPFQAFSTS